MEPVHGVPEEVRRGPWGLWGSLGVRGGLWASVGVRGRPWASMGVHGRIWAHFSSSRFSGSNLIELKVIKIVKVTYMLLDLVLKSVLKRKNVC